MKHARMPLRIAIDEPETVIQVIGLYRHIVFPVSELMDDDWEDVFILLDHNLSVTDRFATSQFKVLAKDTELYETVMAAKAEAIETRLTLAAARNASSAAEFKAQADKLKAQYATLIGHIRHFIFIPPETRPLASLGFVEKAM